MSSFSLLGILFVILFIEESYQMPSTEKPLNKWDKIYRTKLTSLMKIYAYANKRYYISTEFKASYIEAVMFCEEIHMQLVSIQNSEENDVLYKYIRDANLGDGLWTSGTKLLDGHHWIWLTKLDSISYTNWKKGEPNNINEHCLVLNHVKGSGLFWNDLDCHTKQYFICEKDLSQQTVTAGDSDNNKNRESGIFQESYVSPNIALLHFENKSYFVGQYLKATYLEALRLCTVMNMNLVSIYSMEENNRLHKYIRDTSAGDKFWSSGSRLVDGKTWIWMANAQPIYYTNWGTNEPDNSNHFCIQLDNLKDTGLFWNDFDCNTRNYYICEKPRHVQRLSTAAPTVAYKNVKSYTGTVNTYTGTFKPYTETVNTYTGTTNDYLF